MLTNSLPVSNVLLFYIFGNIVNQCLSVHLSFEQNMFYFMLNKSILLNCYHSFGGHFHFYWLYDCVRLCLLSGNRLHFTLS